MELLTLTEAAAAAGISDRTLRKWDRAGRITRVEGPDGRPRYHRSEVEALRSAWSEAVRNGSEGFGSPPSEGVGTDRKPGSEALACQCCKVRESEVAHLRAQIDARTTAEEQLRVLLLQLEKTNAELAASLVVKALPPAQAREEQPRRTRWWQLWGRR